MRRSTRRRAGFTVTEIVVTVAILVVLMAVAAPSVIALRRDLKMTELDATAKAIFVAVQDNLTAMRSADTLELLKAPSGGRAGRAGPMDEGANVVTLSSGDARMGILLPHGTIDPTVADYHYMIRFNQKFGVALEVFYSEEVEPEEGWKTALSGADKADARRKVLVGWYDGSGGGMVEPDDTQQLPEPILVVHNGEELTASVLVPNWSTLSAHAVLTVTVASADGAHSKVYSTQDGTITIASLVTGESDDIVLDSLAAGEQFKTLLSDFTPGCDLVITAELTPKTGGPGGVTYLPSKSGEARTNSLFAAVDATSGTASIAAARHLQNLRAAFSGVSDSPEVGVQIQAAVQQKEIDWTKAGAQFLSPIVNNNLRSYDGAGLPIRQLRVRGVKGETAVGLFGTMTGPSTLKNITLINAQVSAEAGIHPDGQLTPFYQGTLVGSGDSLTVDHCAVYVEWLKETADGKYTYDFERYADYGMTSSAGYTGGLVGWMQGGTIQNSYAALPYINHPGTGSDYASMGGLVGLAQGGVIENSYAAVDQLGGTAELTAMLVGRGTDDLRVSHSYAVGNISATSGERSGLVSVEPNQTVTAKNSYAAVTYRNEKGEPITGKVYGLMQAGGTAANCAYMALSGMNELPGAAGVEVLSYGALKTWQVGEGGGWITLAGENSFPYKKELLGRNYPFPAQTAGAAANVHRGSWPAEDDLWLTYFEVYDDGEMGFSPSTPPDEQGVPSSSSTLQNKMPVRDGYALMAPEKRAVPVDYWIQGEVERTAKRENATLYAQTTLDGTDYYIYILPTEALQTDYADGGYQSIQSGGVSYWYEPHFAAAVAKTGKTAPTAGLTTARIRTPRHLYNLGRFPAFWGGGTVKNVQQELDVSFAVDAYDWQAATGLTAPPTLSPIGNAATAFTAGYSGIAMSGNTALSPVRSITAPKLGATGDYGGLFGAVTGTVKNLSLHLPAGETRFPDTAVKVGLLAARNGGTLENCTVYGSTAGSTVTGSAGGSTVTGPDLVAGLTATATGKVTDCAVRPGEGQGYDGLTLAGKRAAGLVGDLPGGGAVERSYAAATVTGETAAAGLALNINAGGRVGRSYANCHVKATGAAGFAAGFAVTAGGTVTDCYALLTVTGKTASGFASSATGTLTNCYTLADANDSAGKPAYGFTQTASGGKLTNCRYLDRGYTGAQPGTKSVPTDLTAAKLGGKWTDDNGGSSFPFAQALQNQAYPYARISGLPHVGDWPEMPRDATGLVYYEKYSDGSYGFQGLSKNGQETGTLKGNELAIEMAGYGYLLPAGTNPPSRLGTHGADGPWEIGVAQLFDAPIKMADGQRLHPLSEATTQALQESKRNWGSRGVKLYESLDQGSQPQYWLNANFGATVTPPDATPGLGSQERPLQVRTQGQLAKVNMEMDGGSFLRQTHNIPITGEWKTLTGGNSGSRTLDGNGNEISGLTKPLFNALHTDSALLNLTLVDANISGVERGGILINEVSTNTTIQKCRVLNSKIAGTHVSGFADKVLTGAVLSDCSVEGVTVTGTKTAAGFVLTLSGKADNCRVTPWRAGGKADYGDATISATGTNSTAAGFAHLVNGAISGSYAVGTVTANGAAAGFAHTVSNWETARISASYSNCNTTGSSAAGFVYENEGQITDGYALLSVTGSDSGGTAYGFSGSASGKIRNCYSAATVTAETTYGFSATNPNYITNCIYLAPGTMSGGGTKLGYDALAQRNMGAAWGAPASEATHPFAQELQEQTYPFPMLQGMDHYGDWPGRDIQLPPVRPGDYIFGAFHYTYNATTGMMTLTAAALDCEREGSKWDVKPGGATADYFGGEISFPVDKDAMTGYPPTGFGVFWSGMFTVDDKKDFYYNTSSAPTNPKELVGGDIKLDNRYVFVPVTDTVTNLGFHHNEGGNTHNWDYTIEYNEATGFEEPKEKP